MIDETRWAEWEDEVMAAAIPILHDPFYEALKNADKGANDAESEGLPLESYRAEFKRMMGDKDYNEPITLAITRNGRHFRLCFQPEDLDALEYTDGSNVVIVDEDITFRMAAIQAKRILQRRRGCLTPTVYPMTREMFEFVKNDWGARSPIKGEP